MTLHEQIYDLYLLEKQVLGLQGRFDSAKRRYDLRNAKLDQFQQQQAELQDQVKQAKVSVNTYEGQTSELDEKIAKGRDEMNQVTNNKEYSALLVEINTWKDDKSRLDDEALVVIEKLEQKEAALARNWTCKNCDRTGDTDGEPRRHKSVLSRQTGCGSQLLKNVALQSSRGVERRCRKTGYEDGHDADAQLNWNPDGRE